MKKYIILLVLALPACGGSMTESQAIDSAITNCIRLGGTLAYLKSAVTNNHFYFKCKLDDDELQ